MLKIGTSMNLPAPWKQINYCQLIIIYHEKKQVSATTVLIVWACTQGNHQPTSSNPARLGAKQQQSLEHRVNAAQCFSHKTRQKLKETSEEPMQIYGLKKTIHVYLIELVCCPASLLNSRKIRCFCKIDLHEWWVNTAVGSKSRPPVVITWHGPKVSGPSPPNWFCYRNDDKILMMKIWKQP